MPNPDALDGLESRMNIRCLLRYTELAPTQFKDFWRDR
jgi:hypothetical protein